MKKPALIVCNWKMYKTAQEAASFVSELALHVQEITDQLLLAVPFTALAAASLAAEGSPIRIGAQNMHEAEEGAFTGEISARMLLAAGASFVILGHSERRRLFCETDERICAKVKRALDAGLTPILCVGETEEERREGRVASVLVHQLEASLGSLDFHQLQKVYIAYEPVWAIGTGLSATPEIAQAAHAICRSYLKERKASSIPLLYGGSVKGETMGALMAEPDINGVLVGNAGLQITSLLQIINWRSS